MRSRVELTHDMIEDAYSTMVRNIEHVSLEEALFVPEGAYCSILVTLKHAAGWSHVHRSYAFDEKPQHWKDITWPHGLRDTITASEGYLNDLIEWFKESDRKWRNDLDGVSDEEPEEQRP